MILVNEKELNLSVPLDDAERFKQLTYNEQFVIQKISEIMQTKEIRIIDLRKMDKALLAHKTPVGFDVSGKLKNPKTGIEEHWKYSNTPPTIIKDNRVYNTTHFNFFNSATLTSEKDAELIFFILYIVKPKRKMFSIENKEAEAIKKNAARKIKGQVDYWIFTKCTTEDIQRLALRWGITDIDNKSDNELRDELLTILERNEANRDSKRGFKAFIDELESQSDIIKLGSYFMNEIKKQTISFNPSARTCFWSGTNEFIGGVIPPARMADKEEYMIQYLIDHPDEKELFLAAVNDEKLINLNKDYNLIGYTSTLKSWAKKELGLDLPKDVKLAEGKELIKKFIEEQEAKVKEAEPVQ